MDDPELEAIRARLRQEMTQQAAAAAEAPPADAEPPQAALDHPVDVTDAEFQAFLQKHEFVVVDCWAPWCGPCRIVGPIVDQLAKEMAGRVAFAKVNVDVNPRIPGTFGVQGIPTLLMFRRGQLVDRVVGALPKAQLAAHIERARGGGGARRASTPGPRRV